MLALYEKQKQKIIQILEKKKPAHHRKQEEHDDKKMLEPEIELSNEIFCMTDKQKEVQNFSEVCDSSRSIFSSNLSLFYKNYLSLFVFRRAKSMILIYLAIFCEIVSSHRIV